MNDFGWVREIIQEVGEYQLSEQSSIDPSSPDLKGRIDLVTEIDRESERLLVNSIQDKNPADGILAEENVQKTGSNSRRWIIDPLDGTTNYVHHHPFFGISVALEAQSRINHAFAYFPTTDDFYEAHRGKGATKNGQSIQVSQTLNPLDAFLATGFADLRRENARHNLNIFPEIVQKVQGIRRGGSAVHDLCLTAEGVFDAFWEFNLKAWDVAAGSLIIEEAGGTVTDSTGGNNWLSGEHILASNTDFHEQMLEWLMDHLPESIDNQN